MVFKSTQIKTLLSLTKTQCSSKVSTFSGYKCHNESILLSTRDNLTSNNINGCISEHQCLQTFSEAQQEKTLSGIKNTKNIALLFTQDNCPVSSASHMSIIEKVPDHNHLQQVYSTLKRLLQPYKTYYELEWTFPNYVNTTKSKIWLQLDKQTSNGIERVRRLGFTNLDVRLDDTVTGYINKLVLVDSKIDSIMIEILFGSGNYHDYSKDRVLQPNNEDKKVYLLRLRRIHWWGKDYNLARAYLP